MLITTSYAYLYFWVPLLGIILIKPRERIYDVIPSNVTTCVAIIRWSIKGLNALHPHSQFSLDFVGYLSVVSKGYYHCQVRRDDIHLVTSCQNRSTDVHYYFDLFMIIIAGTLIERKPRNIRTLQGRFRVE